MQLRSKIGNITLSVRHLATNNFQVAICWFKTLERVCKTTTAVAENNKVSSKIRENLAPSLTVYLLWTVTTLVVCRDKEVTKKREGLCAYKNSQINVVSLSSLFRTSMLRVSLPSGDRFKCTIYLYMHYHWLKPSTNYCMLTAHGYRTYIVKLYLWSTVTN